MATYWVKELTAYSIWLLSSLKCSPHLPSPGLEKPCCKKECGDKRGVIQGLAAERQLVVKGAALGLTGEWKYRDVAREIRNEKKKAGKQIRRTRKTRWEKNRTIRKTEKEKNGKKRKPQKNESIKYKKEEKVTVDIENVQNSLVIKINYFLLN